MTRRNPWKRLREGIEGPTVTVQLPREWAEELMSSLMQSLEIDDGDMDADDMDDMDPDVDIEMGAMGPPEEDEVDDFMGFSAGEDDEPDFPAGDEPDDGPTDGDGEDEPSAPKKKGPGRPPGSKNKKKDEPKPKKDDDSDSDDDDDEKDEAADYGHSGGSAVGLRPQTALGESAFSRASRLLRSPKVVRRK